jgi:hypothetical protein
LRVYPLAEHDASGEFLAAAVVQISKIEGLAAW